jgi:hypothetical protein
MHGWHDHDQPKRTQRTKELGRKNSELRSSGPPIPTSNSDRATVIERDKVEGRLGRKTTVSFNT